MARKLFIGLSKLPVSRVLPIGVLASPALGHAFFVACLQGLGVTDVSSYLRRFLIPNSVCVLVGAFLGAAHGGAIGLAAGALLGFAFPVALTWIVITVSCVAAYLAVFCGVWVAIFYAIRWLFWSGF